MKETHESNVYLSMFRMTDAEKKEYKSKGEARKEKKYKKMQRKKKICKVNWKKKYKSDFFFKEEKILIVNTRLNE
jgi:predicted ATPase